MQVNKYMQTCALVRLCKHMQLRDCAKRNELSLIKVDDWPLGGRTLSGVNWTRCKFLTAAIPIVQLGCTLHITILRLGIHSTHTKYIYNMHCKIFYIRQYFTVDNILQ